jgi:cytochrome oxidase Cu insertion factor (SCO1/SenC/PrrC family)
MKNSALPLWLAFAAIMASLYGGYKIYQVERSQASGMAITDKLPPLTNFQLTDQDGNTFDSAAMKGKVWVASFFFSTCPSSCARLNANIKYLTTLDELKDVTWISTTVDPVTDTEGVLKAYAENLHADTQRWHFCRKDDFDYVKRLANDMFHVGGVQYKGHNDYVIVVDKHGKIAGMFNGYSQDDLEKGVELLKKCLAEKGPVPAKQTSTTKTDEAPGDQTAEKPASAEAA